MSNQYPYPSLPLQDQRGYWMPYIRTNDHTWILVGDRSYETEEEAILAAAEYCKKAAKHGA